MRTILERRNGRLRVGALVLGLLATALFVFSATAGAANVVSASSLIKATDAAITKAGSAHVDFVAHSSSASRTETILADVGTNSGKELVSSNKAVLSVEVTTTDAYVEGNALGLTTLFGLSSADAKKLGHKWEVWKSGTSKYRAIKADVTLPSITGLLPKAKGTNVSTDVVDGTTYDVLNWTVAATKSTPKVTNKFNVSTGAMTLPTTEVSTDSEGTATSTLSDWGEPISVTAPPPGSTMASSKL
ncbi:MAG TPA: hypothetical protein VGG38_01775 [Acidimicrobiales bacterium]